MSSKTGFERIQHIRESVKLSVYGYVRKHQPLLLSSQIIPDLVIFTVILYADDIDSFTVNNQPKYEYKAARYEFHHLFGNRVIERGCMQSFEWKVQINATYEGRIGIINDTENASKKMDKVTSFCVMYSSSECVNVGSLQYHDAGNHWGSGSDSRDLNDFFMPNDTISIKVDFARNTVLFHSAKQDKQTEQEIKAGVNAIRFAAEFIANRDAAIEFIYENTE